VDNGGDTLKYGWITDETPRPPLPNLSARLVHQFTMLVGDELANVQNPNNLIAHTRSTERGIVTNLENQTRVWKRMLDLLGVTIPSNTEAAKCLGWNIAAGKRKKGNIHDNATTALSAGDKTLIPAHTIAVILLLPPHCPRLLLDQMLHIWMEDFGVAHIGLANSTVCASYDQLQSTSWKTSCTVDLGWSSSWIVPTFRDKPVEPSAMRRMPLGGRHMINMLKYYMSYRQYNLMDQTALLRQVFEKLSYLSLNMAADLALARQKSSGRRIYDRDVVLPDYQRTHQVEVRLPLLLQRDLERQAQKAMQGAAGGPHAAVEDDDEEEDEDFELDEEDDDDDDDDDDDNDVEMVEEEEEEKEDSGKNKKKSRMSGKKKGDHSRPADDDDDDDEETLEQKRKRIMQERAQEERRRKQQQEEEQVLRVSVERFAVPEVLFRPMDAGLQPDLVGLAQAIVQSVQACPMFYRPALYQTVYLVGGVAQLENLKPRLERELRSLVPSDYEMKITVAESPIDRAWMGAKHFFSTQPYTKWSLSRQEWEGSSKRKAYTKLLMNKGGTFV
jgi:actin-related protein